MFQNVFNTPLKWVNKVTQINTLQTEVLKWSTKIDLIYDLTEYVKAGKEICF